VVKEIKLKKNVVKTAFYESADGWAKVGKSISETRLGLLTKVFAATSKCSTLPGHVVDVTDINRTNLTDAIVSKWSLSIAKNWVMQVTSTHVPSKVRKTCCRLHEQLHHWHDAS
jgi:hypothetical protein